MMDASDCIPKFKHQIVYSNFTWHCIFSPWIWHNFDQIWMMRFQICIHNLWSWCCKIVLLMPRIVSPDCIPKFKHQIVYSNFTWHCIFSPLIWHNFDQICMMRFQICIHNLWSWCCKIVLLMPRIVSPDCIPKFKHQIVWYIILIKIMYRSGIPDDGPAQRPPRTGWPGPVRSRWGAGATVTTIVTPGPRLTQPFPQITCKVGPSPSGARRRQTPLQVVLPRA